MRRPFLTAASLLLSLTLSLPGGASASTWKKRDPIPEPTGVEKRLTKLGRGLANSAFGWVEVPVTFGEKLNERRPLTYLLCVAPVLGVWRTAARTGVGLVEVMTFPVGLGVAGFEPLIEPEYIP